MSVESMAIALHHSRAKGAARAILIGIANHDGDGGAWPSMATLAKYGNINLRNAKAAVKQLVELREIEVVIQGGGDGNVEDYRRPNLYKFLLTCPHDCDRSRNHRTNKDVSILPVKSYPQGVSPATPKPSNNYLTKDSVSTNERNRAREAQPEPCSATGQAHRLNRKLGYCADCLTPIALCVAPNRKDGAE